jgi:hypothetical protein
MLQFIGPVLNVFWISNKQTGSFTFNVAGRTLWQGGGGMAAWKEEENLTARVTYNYHSYAFQS